MSEIKMIQIPAGGGCDAFAIAETPITVAQWNEVMPDDLREGDLDHPVTRVNVEDCLDFCKALLAPKHGEGYRLPKDREWCWAAGREPENLADYAVFNQQGICAVKTKLPNEYGLYDMRGLVWEWVGKKGHLRGGSWGFHRDFAQAVFRSGNDPYFRGNFIGFRVVLCGRPPSA